MSTRRTQRDERWQQEFIQEAARIMADGGIDDFELAKRKARARLNLPPGVPTPRNRDIEHALIEYRAIMDGPAHHQALERLRRLALDAMQALHPFRPRLVGPVLSGAADESSAITLHLFADSPEEVAFHLMDIRVPFRDCEQRLRLGPGDVQRIPGYSFVADDVPVEVMVFSGKTRRRAPLSPVDGRPMRRASADDVRELLDGAAQSAE